MGNSIVARLSSNSGPSAENGKLSAKEQAELDQKMAAMDKSIQNRMAGKTEDGATYTADGVRTYGTTAKVDSTCNVTNLTGSHHISAKELSGVIQKEQWDVLGSVLSLRGDDELAFGGDAILGHKCAMGVGSCFLPFKVGGKRLGKRWCMMRGNTSGKRI